ncbi:MAG: hypothetical protein WBD77_27665 [Mycobacterium sp.]
MTKRTDMMMAAGVAFAAALFGLAPAARADEPDPFQVLFGDSGINNTWTSTADAYLDTNDPTLASDLVTCQRSRNSSGLRGCPSRNSPPSVT